MTEITTGKPPHIKQPIYGERALDFVLDLNKEEFDLAEFFGEQAPIRITSISSLEMILAQLIKFFGENDQFTLEQAYKMKEVMLEDLRNNRCLLYNVYFYYKYKQLGTITEYFLCFYIYVYGNEKS